MKIVIFGGEGFLGTKLKEIFLKRGHAVFDVGYRKKSKYKVDATIQSQVSKFLKSKRPDIIIDVVALTNSVECEKNKALAKKLNFTTAKNISLASREVSAKLFFISSSYVFNGERGNYSEEDKTSAQGAYAETKLHAEREILKEEINTVLRVDLLYGYNKNNRPNGIFGKILSGEKIFLGNPNQIRSPLFIEDVPEIIERLYLLKKSGIFHLAGPDKIKMVDLILKLEKLIRRDSKIYLIKSKKLLVPAKKDSSLRISKINKLDIKTTSIKEGLKLIKEGL